MKLLGALDMKGLRAHVASVLEDARKAGVPLVYFESGRVVEEHIISAGSDSKAANELAAAE